MSDWVIVIGIVLIILGIILGLVALRVWNQESNKTSNGTPNGTTTAWVLGILAIIFFIVGIGMILYGYSEGSTITAMGMGAVPSTTTKKHVVDQHGVSHVETTHKIYERVGCHPGMVPYNVTPVSGGQTHHTQVTSIGQGASPPVQVGHPPASLSSLPPPIITSNL